MRISAGRSGNKDVSQRRLISYAAQAGLSSWLYYLLLTVSLALALFSVYTLLLLSDYPAASLLLLARFVAIGNPLKTQNLN